MFYGSISGFYGPIAACANSGYQALFLARKGPGDKANHTFVNHTVDTVHYTKLWLQCNMIVYTPMCHLLYLLCNHAYHRVSGLYK